MCAYLVTIGQLVKEIVYLHSNKCHALCLNSDGEVHIEYCGSGLRVVAKQDYAPSSIRSSIKAVMLFL